MKSFEALTVLKNWWDNCSFRIIINLDSVSYYSHPNQTSWRWQHTNDTQARRVVAPATRTVFLLTSSSSRILFFWMFVFPDPQSFSSELMITRHIRRFVCVRLTLFAMVQSCLPRRIGKCASYLLSGWDVMFHIAPRAMQVLHVKLRSLFCLL